MGSEMCIRDRSTITYSTDSQRNNEKDKSVFFLVRPIRVLDKNHVEIFRPHDAVVASTPQYTQSYHRATAGGKYGIFTYEVANGRTAVNNITTGRGLPDSNGPYLPIFVFSPSSGATTPTSFGPNIPGTEVTGYDKTALSSTVSSLLITENTLQHHRADASRRNQEQDTDEDVLKPDYSVKPRFSQSLHAKGHKGDVTYGVTDHSGDGS